MLLGVGFHGKWNEFPSSLRNPGWHIASPGPCYCTNDNHYHGRMKEPPGFVVTGHLFQDIANLTSSRIRTYSSIDIVHNHTYRRNCQCASVPSWRKMGCIVHSHEMKSPPNGCSINYLTTTSAFVAMRGTPGKPAAASHGSLELNLALRRASQPRETAELRGNIVL